MSVLVLPAPNIKALVEVSLSSVLPIVSPDKVGKVLALGLGDVDEEPLLLNEAGGGGLLLLDIDIVDTTDVAVAALVSVEAELECEDP